MLDGLAALARDVENVLLALAHAGDVVFEACHVLAALGGVEPVSEDAGAGIKVQGGRTKARSSGSISHPVGMTLPLIQISNFKTPMQQSVVGPKVAPRLPPEQLGELGPVLAVGVHAQLEVLAEGIVELGVVILILSQIGEHLHALLHDVLSDYLRSTGGEMG